VSAGQDDYLQNFLPSVVAHWAPRSNYSNAHDPHTAAGSDLAGNRGSTSSFREGTHFNTHVKPGDGIVNRALSIKQKTKRRLHPLEKAGRRRLGQQCHFGELPIIDHIAETILR